MVCLRSLALCAIVVPVLAVPSIPGFTLTWAEDFDGLPGSLPDKDDWIIDTGTSYPGGPPNWGTGETQTYTADPRNVQLTGHGSLKITPSKKPNGTWTSSRIETRRTDFQAEQGGKMRIQGRIKLPNISGAKALGYWAAFWTLGEDLRGNYWNWPSIGELDIMENVNGVDRTYAAMHCGTNPGGACNEPNGLGNSRSCPGSSCNGNWHVYTIEVDRARRPEIIRWYVDGQLYHNVTQTTVDGHPYHNATQTTSRNSTWAQAVHGGHFLLLNIAMGGGFPNGVSGMSTPSNTTESGQSMFVDYVAVYNS